MNLRLITPPTADPVTLDNARLFLRVDGTDDDALIASLIKAATEEGERISRRAFMTQTWDLVLDRKDLKPITKILRPPLQSVTHVKYFDLDNVEHTWTDYVVDARSEPGTIIFHTMPASLQESGAITIRFVAGYGADTVVPERFKGLIKSLVAHWYEHRESREVPGEIVRAFVGERVVWF